MQLKTELSTIMVLVILLLSASLLSGCTTDEREGVVGIPAGEDADGDFYSEENRAEIFVPILNTYDEPKEIVVRFKVITTEQNHHSELKMIRLPENSQEVYSQEIYVPEGEVGEFFDAEITVAEDEVGIVEVRGEQVDDHALINATVANTNFEPKEVTLSFEVITEDGNKESKTMQVTSSENSMEDHSQKIPLDRALEDYHVEIVE